MAERLAGSRFSANAGAPASRAPHANNASLGQRCLAYAIDSVLLFGFCMAFAAAAFLVIFLGSDTGRSTISASEERGFVGFLLATFPTWLVFNILLISLRGQTVGQYVIGLRIARESGGPPESKRVVLYLLALHPLVFHPLLALPWGLFSILGVTIAGSEWLFVFALAMVFLCLVAPIANLAFLAFDAQRRGIHDRIARMKVLRL